MEGMTAVLLGLPKEVRTVALKVATEEAAKPLKEWQKRFARRSERTGALRASINYKVKKYESTGVAVAVVGPDRNYYAGGKAVKKSALIPSNADKPAHYAHLIEFGHHAVVPRKGTSLRKKTAKLSKASWVPAVPFVRPATAMAHIDMATAFDRGMTRGIEKAVAKIKSQAGAK